MLKKAIIGCLIVALVAVAGNGEDKKAKKGKKGKKVALKCPVSGGKIKKASFVAYKGGKVYFCCNNCPKAFAKDTAKFAAKANHQLVASKQVKQAKCPMSGGPIKKEHFVSVAGAKVAFCCPNCKKKAASAKGDEQVKLLFSDAAFKKAGFAAKKAKKKAKKSDS